MFTSFLSLTSVTAGRLLLRPVLTTIRPAIVASEGVEAVPGVTAEMIQADAITNQGLWHLLVQCIYCPNLIRFLLPWANDGRGAYLALVQRFTGTSIDQLLSVVMRLFALSMSSFPSVSDYNSELICFWAA